MISNRVLIIEDDRGIAEYFQAVLTLAGMEVEVFLTAREGLVRLTSSVPGLILLDMRLGQEIGGEDILYQIRSNPRFDGTRVIVVTGYPDIAQSISDLADLVLIKPVGIDQLTTLARRMLSFETAAPKVHSFRDPVTSLFNLEFFHTRLELAFERAKRRADFLYAVIVFAVEVCGENGQSMTPDVDLSLAILAEISRRLKQNLRPTDTIARVAGWKFVTLHEDLRHSEDAGIIVERIREALAAPVAVGEDFFKLRVTCGTATRERGYADPGAVFEAASHDLEARRKIETG